MLAVLPSQKFNRRHSNYTIRNCWCPSINILTVSFYLAINIWLHHFPPKCVNLFEILSLLCSVTFTSFRFSRWNVSWASRALCCWFTYWQSFSNIFNHQAVKSTRVSTLGLLLNLDLCLMWLMSWIWSVSPLEVQVRWQLWRCSKITNAYYYNPVNIRPTCFMKPAVSWSKLHWTSHICSRHYWFLYQKWQCRCCASVCPFRRTSAHWHHSLFHIRNQINLLEPEFYI